MLGSIFIDIISFGSQKNPVNLIFFHPSNAAKGVLTECKVNILEKGMATHSSVPAWRVSRAEESSWLWCRGSQRVGHN